MTEKSFSGADLFGMETPTKRTNDHKETAALVEVLKALKAHPAVAWCERQNSGAAKVGNRFIRFGWRGCSDVLGQLRDGRFLAVEVKGPTGRLRPEQAVFLERINGAGGVAFVARDLRDVHHELNQPQNSILPQPGQAPILRKLIMKVHNYHALASNQSKRRPTQDFDANIDFETFNLTHRGKFLNSLPATHEPCRAGYRPYLTERGDILGVEAP